MNEKIHTYRMWDCRICKDTVIETHEIASAHLKEHDIIVSWNQDISGYFTPTDWFLTIGVKKE